MSVAAPCPALGVCASSPVLGRGAAPGCRGSPSAAKSGEAATDERVGLFTLDKDGRTHTSCGRAPVIAARRGTVCGEVGRVPRFPSTQHPHPLKYLLSAVCSEVTRDTDSRSNYRASRTSGFRRCAGSRAARRVAPSDPGVSFPQCPQGRATSRKEELQLYFQPRDGIVSLLQYSRP